MIRVHQRHYYRFVTDRQTDRRLSLRTSDFVELHAVKTKGIAMR